MICRISATRLGQRYDLSSTCNVPKLNLQIFFSFELQHENKTKALNKKKKNHTGCYISPAHPSILYYT